jgi:hypothetical protein
LVLKKNKKKSVNGSNRIEILMKFPGTKVTNYRQGQGKTNKAETGQKKWRENKRQNRK